MQDGKEEDVSIPSLDAMLSMLDMAGESSASLGASEAFDTGVFQPEVDAHAMRPDGTDLATALVNPDRPPWSFMRVNIAGTMVSVSELQTTEASIARSSIVHLTLLAGKVRGQCRFSWMGVGSTMCRIGDTSAAQAITTRNTVVHGVRVW